MVIEWSSVLIDLLDTIFNNWVCAEYWCSKKMVWSVSLASKKVSEILLSHALSTSSQQLTNSGLTPIFTDDSVADQETRRVGCIFVTTSHALWQLVRGTCPRPCLLCLATAYKANTKDGWVGSEVSLSHSNISPRMARSHKQTTHSCLCAPCSICVVTT